MDSIPIDGLPLDRAPEDDLDGCPMGWGPLDGVSADDIDGVPLGVAVDDIDGMPCESAETQNVNFGLVLTSLRSICRSTLSWVVVRWVCTLIRKNRCWSTCARRFQCPGEMREIPVEDRKIRWLLSLTLSLLGPRNQLQASIFHYLGEETQQSTVFLQNCLLHLLFIYYSIYIVLMWLEEMIAIPSLWLKRFKCIRLFKY